MYTYTLTKRDKSLHRLRQLHFFTESLQGINNMKAEWIRKDEELTISGKLDLDKLDQLLDTYLEHRGVLTERGYESITVDSLTDFDLGKLEKLAAEEDTVSQRALGMMYLHGIILANDVDMARHWLLRSAENGDRRTQYIVARMFEEGSPAFTVNLQTAEYWYKQSLSDPEFLFSNRVHLAHFFLRHKKSDQADNLIREAINYPGQRDAVQNLKEILIWFWMAEKIRFVTPEIVLQTLEKRPLAELNQAVAQLKKETRRYTDVLHYLEKYLHANEQRKIAKRGGLKEYTYYGFPDHRVLRTETITEDKVYYDCIVPVVMHFVTPYVSIETFLSWDPKEISEDTIADYRIKYKDGQ